jgi:Predicted membrane protein (DUF2157)
MFLASRQGHGGQAIRPAATEPLGAKLRRWAADGLITDEQATAILAAERARVGPAAAVSRRVPVAVELLGYLGGVLAALGGVLLTARFWDELPAWSRLTMLGVAAVALWATGAQVPEHADPALWRLRGVLWLLSSSVVAFFAGVVAVELLDVEDERVALLAGLAAAAHAGALWRLRPRPLQHLACLAGLATAVGAGVAALGGDQAAVGLAVWAVGTTWVALAWRGLLPPAGLGLALGAAVALVGAQATAMRWEGAGMVFGLANATALLVAGTTGRRFVLAGVGVVGVFVFLPPTVGYFFADTLGVPVVILAAGAVLLAVTVALLRAQARRTGPSSPGEWPGQPPDGRPAGS